MSDDPGLDLRALRAVRGRRHVETYRDLLDAIDDYLTDHDGGWVAWSGGKDSTTVVDLARRVDPSIPVVFYDCGLDFPETLAYIDALTERWQLNLHIIPTEPDLLTALVAAGDLDPTRPTARLAIDMRTAMITAPATAAHQRFGPANLWGVRAGESAGRRHLYRTHGHRDGYTGIITRRDGTYSYSPIWDWTTPQVWDYLAARDIPTNPVYTVLTRLGVPEHLARVDAMIDPQRLDNGHITHLAHGWPDIYQRLVKVLPRLADYN